MIHWFMKRGRRNALLLAVPALVFAFVLLNTAGSSPPQAWETPDTDNDGLSDAYELFFGLNITTNDAYLDYDEEGLANYGESLKLSDPFVPDTDRDGFSDLVDSNAVSRAYIQWGAPQFTEGDQYEYAHPDWLLGAYKNGGEWGVDWATTQSCWRAAMYGSNSVSSLCIDLDRSILTNNLRYAIHYSGGRAGASLSSASLDRSAVLDSVLSLDLLDTNGAVVAEDLYGNLFDGSPRATNGGTRVVASNVYENSSVIILNVPLAIYPNAAVIQLKACHSRAGGNPVLIYEGLLYIDEDGDGLDADQEKQIGTSDYCLDTNGNGTNDYDECFYTGSSTNNPGGGGSGGGNDDGEDDSDKNGKIIYVDQANGNDQFTGRSPAVVANQKGPKKTVHAGLAIVETNDTIIIRTGNYNEDLNIQGKDVKVFIEGKVRL